MLNLKSLKKRDNKASRIHLTSMMDVFTILLIFLLKSFSTQSEFIINYASQVKLPVSKSEDDISQTFFVEINKNEILLNQKKVVNISDLATSDGKIIPELKSLLETLEKQYISLNGILIDEITIAGDEDINCGIIKMVMSTCAHAGFANIYLATRKD